MCRAAALDAVCETNDIVDELVCHFIALSAQTKLVMLASVEYLICKLLPRSAQHQKGARILLGTPVAACSLFASDHFSVSSSGCFRHAVL